MGGIDVCALRRAAPDSPISVVAPVFRQQDGSGAKARSGCGLVFGTGGLRGVLGAGPDRMNCLTVARATEGLAGYLLSTGGRRVTVAYDTRKGSQAFAAVTSGVLALHGIRVWMFEQPFPTPILSFAVRALGCDAGVMITASHNPANYNGYKVYGADGGQITDEVAKAITEHIQRVDHTQAWLPRGESGARGLVRPVPPEVYHDYIQKTLSCRLVAGGVRPVLRLAYTPLYGTGLLPVRDVLSCMPGIEFVEVAEQCAPDGSFPTCPRPNPELREALAAGIDTARREAAELLLATDPDCDRVGVAVRQRDGDYRVLTGNEVGLLMMEYVLSRRPDSPGATRVVFKTVVTSDLAFSIARRYGAEVREVLTGFKYIGEAIGCMEARGETDRFAFGFEDSCGYLAGTHVRDKDGVMACMLVAEMAQAYAAEGKTLAQAMDALYADFGYLSSRLLSFDIREQLPMEAMADAMKRLRAHPPEVLGYGPVCYVRDYLPGISGLPPSDVLCFGNAAGAKAVVRPSGTEPKMKVYLSAKGKNTGDVEQLLDRMARQVEGWFGA